MKKHSQQPEYSLPEPEPAIAVSGGYPLAFDYRNKRVACPLSAGINSMAVAIWLANYEYRPKDVYVFYAHFVEHSPRSLEFVKAGVEYLKKHFENVIFEYTENSIIKFFEEQNMIPHPTYAPCTRQLKIEPSERFKSKYSCTVDLVGYVRDEQRRVKNMLSRGVNDLFKEVHFPILDLTDVDCFELVKKEIGWYPEIYDLRWNDPGFMEFAKASIGRFGQLMQNKILKKVGSDKPVLKHNNCLPCKNAQIDDLLAVEYFFPDYFKSAIELSKKLQSHWGRDKDSFADAFMTTFGRDDWEVEKSCPVCLF